MTRADAWPPVTWPSWGARLIFYRLAEGAALQQLAPELQLDPDVVRGALLDTSRRMHGAEPLASALRLLAGGSTIEEVASELELSEQQIRTELEPSESLTAALSGALLGRAALPRGVAVQPQGPLRTMPVRFPEPQYQRLKKWSEAHNFPMAVVVRGLVERFLDEQERLAA